MKQHTSNKSLSTTRTQDVLNQLWNALLTPRGVVTYIPMIVVAISMFFGASWQLFWTTTDAARYQCYGLDFWLGSSTTASLLPPGQCDFLNISGSVPAFHLLPLEYPPLTLLPFSLPLLGPLHYYQVILAIWMALMSVLIYWLLLRYGPRGAGLTFAFFALIGAWGTAEGRFDLLPAALTLLALIAAERKHWAYAYIALAFGVLLKIYPLLLFPAFFIAEQREAQLLHLPRQSLTLKTLPGELWQTFRGIAHWRWKNSLIFFGVLVGITGFFALFDFQGAVLSQLTYFAQRPIQIEALGSAFLWLATQFGFPVTIIFSYGSINMDSTLGGIVSLVGDIGLVLGYAYIMWTQWRGKLDVTQASIAILLVFIGLGKVFSPQYLIWLIPLLAYSSALDTFWLIGWGIISALTTVVYPILYDASPSALGAPFVPGFIQVVTIRNLLFILLTLAYLFDWLQIRRRKPLPPKITGRETRPLFEASLTSLSTQPQQAPLQ